MAKIKGKWLFNDTFYTSTDEQAWVRFKSNGIEYVGIKLFGANMIYYTYLETFTYAYAYGVGWKKEEYKVIDFGEFEQTVPDSWYNVFVSNATKILETVAIMYNGELVSIPGPGETAELHTAEKTMKNNIKVIVPSSLGGADIGEYIKNVTYTPGTGIFTFTKQDGSTYKVDLAIEKVVTNFTYNSSTKSLVLTLADGTTQSIPISNFVNLDDVNNEIDTTKTLALGNTDRISTLELAYGQLDDKIDALEEAVGNSSNTPLPVYESVTIPVSDWIELTSSSPYTHRLSVTLPSATNDAISVELLNNQPILFAKHGFAINSVSDGMAVIYCINKPESDVTLKFEVMTLNGGWYNGEMSVVNNG